MPFDLPTIDCTQLDPTSIQKYIKSEEDAQAFKETTAYKYYINFLGRLCEAAKGQPLPSYMLQATSSPKDQVDRMLETLDIINSWIEEVPPLKTPQRFGNLAFRTWGQKLEQV